ncbi:restriction endonuclease [Paenibacillus hodogayensis]|uniref:Restriction endonuclease n=1 Tax=Paenibacillus hodogayensis TaxID=279208 RepID=A0ABV5VSE6_9BACL
MEYLSMLLASNAIEFPKLPFGPAVSWMLAIMFALSILTAVVDKATRQKRKRRKRSPAPKKAVTTKRTSSGPKSDEAILSAPFSDLSGAEFERLLALYFRDQAYTVKEVGVGGSDGGVDLVIIDKRGEKTAVQAKCYSVSNKVPVQTVRELVGAKRNHDCILTLLVTTSDLTGPAKAEAEQFKVEYWHGALLEQKLRSWGKWQPGKKIGRQEAAAKSEIRKAQLEVAAASTSITCGKCGAPMVRRKSKNGEEFLGCSKFPSCRQTKPI